MKQRLLQAIARSARLTVINELKRTQGLTVRQLAERLGMSYMGVKDVCLDLQKRKLVDTWRLPTPRGRPQMLYRLTERAHELFPVASNPMTLQLLAAAQGLFGSTAADKLLLVVFQKMQAEYAGRLPQGDLETRAERLAKIRDDAGYMSGLEKRPDGLVIVEHHSPILDVLRAYPLALKLETEMFQRLLGVPVRREEQTASGLYRASFHLGGTP